MSTTNLFADLPNDLPKELVEILVDDAKVRIERIVSTGHQSPEGFWYDQNETEWVILLKGEAMLRFQNEDLPRQMFPGDHVTIPAHRRHRVESTSTDGPTVWLAVFF